MEAKTKRELRAIEAFTHAADKANSEGKQGRSLLLEVSKDKEVLDVIGNLEYISKLANDNNQANEDYYKSLSNSEIEVVEAYYRLFKKMSVYSNGEGSDSKRDKKFAAFIEANHKPLN